MATRLRPQILAAVPTAFTDEGAVDVDATQALTHFMAESGIDGLFVCGTAGEFPALSALERETVMKGVVQASGRRLRQVLHVGASSAREVSELLDSARRVGIEDVAVITPYFLPGTRSSLKTFYEEVSALAEGLRTYIYVYRAVCGSYVDPELMAELASLPSIVGAKISGETPETIGEFVAATPGGFEIYAGADQELVPMAKHGALGLVSAMAAALPKPFVSLAHALAEDGDIATWQGAVDDVCRVLQGQISRTKYALRLQGVPVGTTRMALPGIDGHESEIRRIVELYG